MVILSTEIAKFRSTRTSHFITSLTLLNGDLTVRTHRLCIRLLSKKGTTVFSVMYFSHAISFSRSRSHISTNFFNTFVPYIASMDLRVAESLTRYSSRTLSSVVGMRIQPFIWLAISWAMPWCPTQFTKWVCTAWTYYQQTLGILRDSRHLTSFPWAVACRRHLFIVSHFDEADVTSYNISLFGKYLRECRRQQGQRIKN